MEFQGLSQGSIADVGDRYTSLDFGAQYFHPQAEVRHFQPGWNSKIPLIFQIMPCIGDDGRPLPSYFRNDGEVKFSDFYMKMPEVTFGSAEKVTMVLFDPIAEGQKRYNAKHNPYMMFRDRVRRLAGTKEGEIYKGLFTGGKGQGPAIPYISDRFFFNSIVWQSMQGLETDAKFAPVGLQDSDRFLPIVSGKNSFGRAILSLLRNNVAAGNPDLLLRPEGLLFVAFNPEHVTLRNWMTRADQKREMEELEARTAEQLSATEGGAEGAAGFVDVTTAMDEQDSGDFQKYRIAVLNGCVVQSKVKEEGEKPKRYELPPQMVKPVASLLPIISKRYRPVKSTLVVPSHADQVDMIARAFADKPDLLRVGFGDTEYFRHPTVQKFINNPVGGGNRGLMGQGDSVPSGAPSLLNSAPASLGGMQEVSEEQLNTLFDELDDDEHAANRAAMRGE